MAWRNKHVPQSLATRRKAAERARLTFTGVPKSESARKKNILANIGEKSHFWKGGMVSLARRIRNSNKSIEWRTNIFVRDNYTCKICGARNGRGKAIYLEADHIIPFSKLFHEFLSTQDRSSSEDEQYVNSLNYNDFWDINNGKTLCKDCHKKTDTFSYKAVLLTNSKNNKGIYLK
jgi:5-methylcytosine-specific restriction endonuclease McrA